VTGAESQPPAAQEEQPTHDAQPSIGANLVQAIVRGNSVVVTILAIALALLLGALLIAFSDDAVLSKFGYFFAAPMDALNAFGSSVSNAYGALFRGAIVAPSTVSAYAAGHATASQVFYPICLTLADAAPLILAGLSVSIAFRAGLFNIGAQGQVITGGLLAGYLGFAIHLPIVMHLVVAIAGGFVGGAAWGWIAGTLKATTGAHEVITTIMLNYVAASLLNYLLATSAYQRPGQQDLISKIVRPNARLPLLAGTRLPLDFGVIVAILAAVACAWLLSRSTFGFELKAVGGNADAARTAGMSVGGTYALVMLVAGGLAGLAGGAQVLSTSTSYSITGGLNSSLGPNAITVALLGRARPLGTVLAGLLFGALQAGSITMQAVTQTPVDVVTVVQALIVLFIAAPPLVRGIFRLRGSRTGGQDGALAKGWNG